MLHSVAISQGDVWHISWNGARSRRFVAALLRRLFRNSGWRWRWSRVDNALGACDAGKVRDEESRRASYADYRDGEWTRRPSLTLYRGRCWKRSDSG